jgi:hypothetical protein
MRKSFLIAVSVLSLLVFSTAALGDITTGLRAYYKFDEGSGTTAYDSSGNGNTGTLEGSPVPSWVGGINPYFETALDFDTQNYVNTSLDMPSGGWTFSEWVSVSSCPSGICLFFTSGVDPDMFMLGYDSGVLEWAGYIVYTKHPDGPCAHGWTTFDYNISDAGWTHLTVVYDESESELRLYINGTLNDTDSQSGCDLGSFTYVSHAPDGIYGTNGMVDDARFYSRALTDSDVAGLFAVDHAPPPHVPLIGSGNVPLVSGLLPGIIIGGGTLLFILSLFVVPAGSAEDFITRLILIVILIGVLAAFF